MHGEIWIDKVKPDPNNPRKEFDEEKLTALAEGIKIHGVINPIEIDENNIILDGERRWRASKMAGLTKIPFKRKKMAEHDKEGTGYRTKEQLQANLTGENLRIDEARESIELLLAASNKEFTAGRNWKPDEQTLSKLGKELGVSRQYLGQILKISKEAAPEVIRAVEKKEIPFSTAVEIANVKDKEVQKDFLDYVNVDELTRDDTRKLAKKLNGKNQKQAKEIIETDKLMSPEIEASKKAYIESVKAAHESGDLGKKPDKDFNNFLFLTAISEQVGNGDVFCPNCKKQKGLKWICCNETLETSVKQLKKKYEKVVR